MILARMILAGALLGVAALGAERVAAWAGRPRRWIWVGALAGSLLLPAVAFRAPALLPQVSRLWRGMDVPAVLVPAWQPAPVADAAPAAIPSASRMERLESAAGWAWLASSGALLLLLAATFARMRRARAGWTPAVMDGTPVLLANTAGPAVVGLLRPAIVIPRWVAEMDAKERRLIIRHEMEHVTARDTWMLAASAVLVAAAPWNPALWWQHRRLRLAMEIDCDARVLARETSPRAYGRALLRTAGAAPRLSPLALAWGEPTTHLEQRIHAMTSSRPRRLAARAFPLLALCAATIVVACDVADGRGPVASGGTARRSPNPPTHAGETTYWENADGTSMVQAGVPAADWEQRRFGIQAALHGPIDISSGPPYPLAPDYATVASVTPGSAAADAGVQAGDTILSVNGISGRSSALFPGADVAGKKFSIRLRRAGREIPVAVVVRAPEREPVPARR